MKARISITLYLVLVVIIGPGCIFLNTFQSPRVLEKGEMQIGLAATGLGFSDGDDVDAVFGIPEINGRLNIGNKTDLGLRVTFPAIGADIRYQLVDRKPFYVAAGVGGSGVFISDATLVTFTPSLSLGTDNVYTGLKYAVLGGSFEEGDIEFSELGPGIMFGASLGNDRLRFIPELNIYFPEDGTVTGFGVALNFTIPNR